MDIFGAPPIHMQYKPKHAEIVIDTVTTANKNIQSYFMRTDQSYYVPDSQRHSECLTSGPPVRVVITNGQVIIDEETIQMDIIMNSSYNVQKYQTTTHCQDRLYSVIRDGIKRVNLERATLQTAEAVESTSHRGDSSPLLDAQQTAAEETTKGTPEAEKDKSIPTVQISRDPIVPRQQAVQLIFFDFMSRSDIMSLIDILLNQIGFREIMVLPYSLAVSFSLGVNFCSFVYDCGFSFIDDFVLAESFSPVVLGSCLADDEDFVEDFSRLKLIDESMKYACETCECRESSEERIRAHIEKEHVIGEFFYYVDSPLAHESYDNRIKYLFGKEKAARISANRFSIDTHFEGARPLTQTHLLALHGTELFSSLEGSKDCWMTGEEWRAVRLRALKEKLLFFI